MARLIGVNSKEIMDFKIFFSYSTHDLDDVRLLQEQLVNTGIQVFVAEHSVHAGEQLAPKIIEAIQQCDLFIVLWSQNAKDSEWVAQEIGQARALRKPILPLVLTEGLNLPGFIKNLKYLPVFPNKQAAVLQAREIILNAYRQKHQALIKQKEEEQKTALALLGIGSVLLWAFSQK